MTISTLVGENWGDGPHWWPLIWLVWLAFIVTVFALFLRRGRRGPWRGDGRPSAEAVLGERYARGEIDAAEYRERLDTLRSHAVR